MRQPSRALRRSLLLVLLFCVAGYASSYVCRSVAEKDARHEVERRVATFQAFVREHAKADSPYMRLLGPINWYRVVPCSDQRDAPPWYYFARLYCAASPEDGSVGLPCAFVKAQVGPLPFMVRVQQGYETNGQGGAQAVVTYLTFFGRAWRVHRLLLYVT
jgi:hypothetical protein